MNKAPQPITGPPSTPHPAPSPGLSQVRFPASFFFFLSLSLSCPVFYPPFFFPPKKKHCRHSVVMHIIKSRSHNNALSLVENGFSSKPCLQQASISNSSLAITLAANSAYSISVVIIRPTKTRLMLYGLLQNKCL